MSATAIMQERRRALIRAWTRDPLVLVQAETPGALAGPDVGDDGGAIVRRPGAALDRASLWVAGGADGRSAWLRFLEEAHGARASEAELDGWDIDHLLDRARAPMGCWVRVEAIPAQPNRRWAALFEATAGQEAPAVDPERRTMNWLICAKLAGKPPPTSPDDDAQLEHLVGFFASIGLEPERVRESILGMLHAADRRAS